ncbi:fused response regulator/phosphatase [Rhodopirellula sp. ICT_H3.1]|uniref:Fused response regulator/phosphatase n=2 Tax=Aporhodopirellula aestuarii TaxID=2950107 RepID=A0ABT0TXP6_9BACT|nr:fused response regulator/phosphatase [Aporhodopirellula aestuarii]
MREQQEAPLEVLVVEDSIAFAKLVIALLRNGLSTPHNVRHVERVAHGVDVLHEFNQDLVILDMHLPDASGLDTFEAIYGAGPDVPIVILSSDDTEELAMEAVRRGAQDYLIKGADDPSKLMRSIRFAIERKKRLHAESELEAARQIQQSLLPNSSPVMKGFDTHGAMFPAVETSGDYFDFIVPLPSIPGDVNGIAVGDVSGHGLGAAMMMAQTRGCLHSFAMVESDLGRVLELTNEVLVRNRNEHLVTLLFGYIDPESNRFTYASAGHQGWHFSPANGFTELESTGMLLGAERPGKWGTEYSPELQVGDFLIIMTDGITEAMSPTGEMFGEERFAEFIREHRDRSAEQIVNLLRKHLYSFTEGHSQQDDMTMVIIKVTR